MRLTFLGGTGTLTGSKYLLEHDGHRLLVNASLHGDFPSSSLCSGLIQRKCFIDAQ